MKNGRIKSKKVVLPEPTEFQSKALKAVHEMDLMLSFGEFKVYSENGYSETLNHWLSQGLAKIETRPHPSKMVRFYEPNKMQDFAVFIGDRKIIETAMGLLLHYYKLKPYLNAHYKE